MSDAPPPFHALTPHAVLDALAAVGLHGDGRLLQLNSYENRVFQVALERGDTVVAKFYRPGRWSEAQILEEHAFALELAAADAQIFDIVARALYPAIPEAGSGHLQALMHGAARLGLTDWVLYGIEGGIDIDDYDIGQTSSGGSSVLMKSLAHGHDAGDHLDGARCAQAMRVHRLGRGYGELGRMLAEGKITDKEYKAAIAEPVTPVITPSSTGCQTAGGAAFFCDYVTWIIKNDPAFGATEDERWAAFQRGGWKIMTTLDVEMQAAAEAALNERVPKIVPEGDIAGSAVSVQVGTGRVLAMAQSKDYSADPEVVASGANYTSINYNTDSKYGSSTGFPVGSTYKIFTLIEWLKQGHGLNEVVSGKVKDWKMSEFKNSCEPTGGPNWRPVNYAGAFDSTTTVMNALKNSYNLNFITMASKMDLCNIRKDAEAFGVHRADQKTLKSNPSTIIGTEEIAPLAMAVATAGIANDGKTCTAIAIDEIIDYKGKKITPPKSKCTQSVTPAVARTTAYAMENVHSAGGTRVR